MAREAQQRADAAELFMKNIAREIQAARDAATAAVAAEAAAEATAKARRVQQHQLQRRLDAERLRDESFVPEASDDDAGSHAVPHSPIRGAGGMDSNNEPKHAKDV
jgi:hypothetical protein